MQLTSLELSNLRLTPHAYEEDVDRNGRLTICVRFQVSLEQAEALRELGGGAEPVPVIRHGIDAVPRQMWVAPGAWSQHDDSVKYQVFLFDPPAAADHRESAGGRGFQIENLRRATALLAEEHGALLDLLVDKNVVTAEERAGLAAAAMQQRRRRLIEFERVPDLDSFEM